MSHKNLTFEAVKINTSINGFLVDILNDKILAIVEIRPDIGQAWIRKFESSFTDRPDKPLDVQIIIFILWSVKNSPFNLVIFSSLLADFSKILEYFIFITAWAKTYFYLFLHPEIILLLRKWRRAGAKVKLINY